MDSQLVSQYLTWNLRLWDFRWNLYLVTSDSLLFRSSFFCSLQERHMVVWIIQNWHILGLQSCGQAATRYHYWVLLVGWRYVLFFVISYIWCHSIIIAAIFVTWSSLSISFFKNVGHHFETWNTGVLGPVTLSGLNEGEIDLSGQKWTYQVTYSSI